MKPNHKKDEIFVLITNEDTGIETRNPDEIRKGATEFYKNHEKKARDQSTY